MLYTVWFHFVWRSRKGKTTGTECQGLGRGRTTKKWEQKGIFGDDGNVLHINWAGVYTNLYKLIWPHTPKVNFIACSMYMWNSKGLYLSYHSVTPCWENSHQL